MSGTLSKGLPAGLLLAYYGDDFTGSTDAMEGFAAVGLSTALFLSPPKQEDLARFGELRCIGLAGQSRSKSPAWMQEHLKPALQSLAALRPPILQYKVCSTFDSSPTIGSIGCALDIGVPLMQGDWSPMVIGVPQLRRYQAFGHLFAAAADGKIYRLDRHPSMSYHPITPMDESDLRLHLAKQTMRTTSLIDHVSTIDDLKGVTLIDVKDPQDQLAAGKLIWENIGEGVFSASSSGLQYALRSYFASRGWLDSSFAPPSADSVSQVFAVSGSCSPNSAKQLRWAQAQGFHLVRLSIEAALANTQENLLNLISEAQSAISQGKSCIVYSAMGPDDSSVTSFADKARDAGLSHEQASAKVAQALAFVMREVQATTGIERIAVAGGDSSGEVASAMGLQALTVKASLVPGAPLCKAWWADTSRRESLEICLKGGQMGGEDFYGRLQSG